MATNRSKPAPKRETRTPVASRPRTGSLPPPGVAENVAQAFGLIVPEYDAIRTEHTTAVKRMAEAFEGSLDDKATAMHLQRIVGVRKADLTPAVARRHGRGRPGFVDEDELPRVEGRLRLTPCGARGGDVRTLLLGRAKRFFYS